MGKGKRNRLARKAKKRSARILTRCDILQRNNLLGFLNVVTVLDHVIEQLR